MPRTAAQLTQDQSSWGCDLNGRDLPARAVSRRGFLRNGALALVGTAAIPAFLTRSVFAEVATARAHNRKLVVIFQRGAADGLNIVVPYQDPHYYAMRPTIAIPSQQVLPLDARFGLHPAMASLAPLFKQGHLAVVHATGSEDTTRSHFDAQDFMESGTPGIKSTPDGWLNRALASERLSIPSTTFRAVALGSQVPRTLQGKLPAIALSNVADFAVARSPQTVASQTTAPRTINPQAAATQSPVASAFESLYDESTDAILHGAGQETFEAMRMLRSANPAHYQPSAGVNYPRGTFGNSLKQIAQLMKADLGVEAAFTDVGGWDTHQNQGAATGQLADRLRDFSDSISAFWRDMGDSAEDITLVTMSEFGRTAHQNGTGGTDHGHANVMFVLGGQVRGGRVYGKWPGLAPENLNEGRDLVVTTDYRQVLAEVTCRNLGLHTLEHVFPGLAVSSDTRLNIL